MEEEQQEELEHTLLVLRDAKLYRIPPRQGARGYMSGTWLVADCIFTGGLRVLARGRAVQLRLEDAATGELFAVAPCTPETQHIAVEPAADSSRNWVLRVVDPATQRHAFLGLGLPDRAAAFELSAALEDHAKQCRREDALRAAAAGGGAAVSASVAAAEPAGGSSSGLFKDPGDLRLKEGETLRIEVKRPASRSSGGGLMSRHSGSGGAVSPGAGLPLLRPPSDGGGGTALPSPPVLPPPPQIDGQQLPVLASPQQQQQQQQQQPSPPAVTVASSVEGWTTFH